MTATPAHIPVLAPEVAAHLDIKPDGLYADATFGLGGYSRLWLERGARVAAFDRDPAAAPLAAELAETHPGRFTFYSVPFSQIGNHCLPESLDGIAFDLGVSSPQLDRAERGFSFRLDGPLDMRMSQNGPSAADLINSASQDELSHIIATLGEERFARKIAAMITRQRPFVSTLALAEAIRRILPRGQPGIDPATRTFQALRMAVNSELEEIAAGLAAAPPLLKTGAALAVVSFHSLEDRAVKTFFKAHASLPGQSRHQPPRPQKTAPALLKIVTPRPIVAGGAETLFNPRARSAKLRVARKAA